MLSKERYRAGHLKPTGHIYTRDPSIQTPFSRGQTPRDDYAVKVLDKYPLSVSDLDTATVNALWALNCFTLGDILKVGLERVYRHRAIGPVRMRKMEQHMIDLLALELRKP